MKFLGSTLLAFVLLAPATLAQVQIDKRRPAPAEAEIGIQNDFGTITVIGWEQNEVQVTGVLAPGAEGLEFDGGEGEIWISVENPESWLYGLDDDTEYKSRIEVHVPRGSSLRVESLNATIIVTDVNGELELATSNGAINVSGDPYSVDAESMTGDIDIQARSAEVEVESISGLVKVRGATREVTVRTLSGDIDVAGEKLAGVQLESTTGNVLLAATLTDEGEIELETFSGNVVLALTPGVKARFEILTFAGEINSELGPKPGRDGRFDPYKKLTFSTGFNDYTISVETYDGNIQLRLVGAEASGR